MRGKSPIGGREITRDQLLKGLPNPKIWKTFSERVYAKFRAKPNPKRSVWPIEKLKKEINKLSGTIPKVSEPSYAKAKRRPAKPKRHTKRKK
jgi:hypothetical protein